MATIRRHLIIEPRFQLGFTLAFVRGMLLAVSAPAVTIILTVVIIAKNPSLSAVQREALDRASCQLVLLFGIGAVLLAVASAVVALLLSHRYAGPLKRVESWAARHLLGEPVDELVLRPGDELAPTASALSRIVKGLK